MEATIIYIIFALSILLNIVLLLRMQQLQKNIRKIKGGVELSREELEQLRERIKKIKELS